MINSIKLLMVWGLFFTTTLLFAYPTAKVTARVIDDEGKQLQGIKVSCRFELPKVGGLGVKSTIKEGLTDQNGLFTAKGSTSSGFASCGAKDKNYYRGGAGTGRFTGVSGIYGFRKWQPWNPTIDVILKRKINPIPMYVGELTGKYKSKTGDLPPELPEEGKFFGYDLIAKDWVVPHGQGLHSDFMFKIDVAHYVDTSDYDSTMTLKFSNPDDGIQSFYTPKNRGSDLRSAHHAPLAGYQDKLKTRDLAEQGKVYKPQNRDDQNYYFRIRTKRDEQGNIIEAHYGKMYGGFIFSFPSDGEKGEIYFSYYLNPNNNDTNVENAPEKNLFPKPKGHRGPYLFNP